MQIKISNLTFAYDGSYDNVFEDVSFVIDTDWKLGFTGRNGRGKTTFFNLLLGRYKYSGSIVSSVNFEYFPFEIKHDDYLAIDVIRDIAPAAEDWEIIKELTLLEVSDDKLYQQFFALSKGEQTKLMLAALFLKQNSFLLIDEPTNHLDEEAREVLCSYLKLKKGFILISHDRMLLDKCTDHTLAINKTNIEIQKGNFSSWYNNKQMQDSYETARNEKLKKDIKRLSASSKQKAEWSAKTEKSKKGATNSGSKIDRGFVGHKAAKLMKRAAGIENRRQNMITEKSALMKNIELNEELSLTPLKYHSERICSVSDLSVSYDGRQIFNNLSFEIRRGDRIALQGKNGCGKSSILKLICGQEIPHTGYISVGSGVKISYVSQSTGDLYGSLIEYAEKYGIELPLFLSILRKMDFSREQFEVPVESYSRGQKKKVLIARSLCERAHLYVWDEPLNYIDIISRIQLEDLILKCSPTMIFVEHDSTFRNNIATDVVEI